MGQFRTRALHHRADPFEHLVGAAEERGRDSEADDLRRFKIDGQLKSNRLPDWPAFGRTSCLKSKPGIFFILRCR